MTWCSERVEHGYGFLVATDHVVLSGAARSLSCMNHLLRGQEHCVWTATGSPTMLYPSNWLDSGESGLGSSLHE